MSSLLGVSSYNVSAYSRFNISENVSDIRVFVNEFKERVLTCLKRETECGQTPFRSFAEKKLSVPEITWLQDNNERFFKYTANENLVHEHYLKKCGFICSMIYTPDGEFIIVGHSSGLIQATSKMSNPELKDVVQEYSQNINEYFRNELRPKTWYPMFYREKAKEKVFPWVKENYDKFLKDTPNKCLQHRWYSSEKGAITSMQFSPNGYHIIVGHASGSIEMRHGSTGTVLCTLRNIQFPPKPVHALEYSPTEPNICYAACMDGAVYRIEIPHIDTSVTDPPAFCIRADPMLESLNMQFYGSPGISSHATPFVTQRFAALSLGITPDLSKMVVGYGDTSIKVYDMETQEVVQTYKVHKLRLQFIPKKLQRMHFGKVVALRTHPQQQNMFASGAWDNTLRIWDVRCQVGCVMTFVGVNICSDSIDLNREHCITGSWLPTEALSVWDLTARKLLTLIRVQNRRQDVDGEYIYACRYWRSTDYNRKGKYAIIGGSGTSCLEVINLHNRYITCSYPTTGAILALTSHQERIAYGGTSSSFNIVSFYDPKCQKDKYEIGIEPDYDRRPSQGVITLFHDEESMFSSSAPAETEMPATPSSEEYDGEESKVDDINDDVKQDDEKPHDEKPHDDKPQDGKTPDKKAHDEKTPDKKPHDEKTSDKKAHDDKTQDKKAHDDKTKDKKHHDEKTSHKKAHDDKTKNKKHHDEKTSHKKAHDDKTQDKKPHEEKTSDKKTHDGKTPDKKAHDEKTSDKKSHDNKTSDKKPHDEKSPDKKSHDEKSPDKKSHDKKSHEEKPEK